jgi:ATPase
VEDGIIKKFYDLHFTVKVPEGMIEADLARPVIEVVDYETKRAEFEIYTYGEEVVVMPLEGMEGVRPLWSLAERQIAYEIGRLISGPIEVSVDAEGHATVYISDKEIPRILGREGKRIAEIERELGLRIDVRSLKEADRAPSPRQARSAEVDMDRRHAILRVGDDMSGRNVEVIISGRPVFQGTVGRDGVIRVVKGGEAGKALEEAFFSGKKVTVVPLD